MEEIEATHSSVNRPPPRHVTPIGEEPASLRIADAQPDKHMDDSGYPSALAQRPSQVLLHAAVDDALLDFLGVGDFVCLGVVCNHWRTTAERIFNLHPRSKLLMARANIPWQRHQTSRIEASEMSWFRFASLWTCRLQKWARKTVIWSRGKITGDNDDRGPQYDRAFVKVTREGPDERVCLALPWSDVCLRVAQAHLGARHVDRASAGWRLDMGGGVIAFPELEAYFLPKRVKGRPVLVHQGCNQYLVDLVDNTAGHRLDYRLSKDLQDKAKGMAGVLCNTIVEGTDDGDWVQVSEHWMTKQARFKWTQEGVDFFVGKGVPSSIEKSVAGREVTAAQAEFISRNGKTLPDLVSAGLLSVAQGEASPTKWNNIIRVADRLIKNYGTDVFLAEVLEEASGQAGVEELFHYIDSMLMKAE